MKARPDSMLTDGQKIATQTYARAISMMFQKMFEIGNAADDRSEAVIQTTRLMREFSTTPEIGRLRPELEQSLDVLYDEVKE